MNKNHHKKSGAWPSKPLADVGTFLKGAGISKNEVAPSGLNAVRYGELYTRYNFKIEEVATHISEQTAGLSTKIQYGDVLLAGSGETAEEIGKSAAYLCREDGYAGGDIIIFRPGSEIDGLFMAYQLNVGAARKKISELGQGQSVVHLYPRHLKNVQVAIPPLAEQKRIVAVLETWDSAIKGLERKLTLKEISKNAIFRKLLTGKVRLPGFAGAWKIKKLGDVLDYERPDQYIVKDTDYRPNAKTPVLTANKGFILGYTNEDFGIRQDLPVIIFDDFTVDSKYVDFPFKIKSSAIKILTVKTGQSNLRYLYERMKIMDFQVGEHKRHYISDYQHISIPLPDYLEQVAIGEVLATANQEIKKLEAKRDLLEDQKKYLLNNFVTGAVRLSGKNAAVKLDAK